VKNCRAKFPPSFRLISIIIIKSLCSEFHCIVSRFYCTKNIVDHKFLTGGPWAPNVSMERVLGSREYHKSKVL